MSALTPLHSLRKRQTLGEMSVEEGIVSAVGDGGAAAKSIERVGVAKRGGSATTEKECIAPLLTSDMVMIAGRKRIVAVAQARTSSE